MYIFYAIINDHQMIKIEINQKFNQFENDFDHIRFDDYNKVTNRFYFLFINMNSM